nr:hypothetical protein [Pseudomonadales bacterium]MCP5185641.1 hypothetical protein [Pseudomonadales bacterium]
MKKLFVLTAVSTLVSLVAGCASDSRPSPTHYWGAAEGKTERQYKEDNASCESSNGVRANNPMLSESGSFQSYKDCMIEHGYVLRTY